MKDFAISPLTVHALGSALVWEIFRFRWRNAVVQTARNISGWRKLNFNLPLTVHAVASSFFIRQEPAFVGHRSLYARESLLEPVG